MMKKITAWQIVTYIFYFVIIIFALAALSSRFSFFGIRLYTVQSGSMEPTIKTGSLILVKTKGTYAPSDIITFYKSSASKEAVTHRLLELKTENGITYGITQGDANNTPDQERIYLYNIIGKVRLAIPYLGYPLGFARTTTGVVILIIIPTTIIIYDEILKIKQELRNKKKI